MPKKKVEPKPAGFLGFINYELSKAQKTFVREQPFGYPEADDLLVKLCQSDYKVTFSYDDYHSCYSAFLMCKDKSADNAGYILSGKGSSPLKALKQVAYIHYVVFNELWASVEMKHEELDD